MQTSLRNTFDFRVRTKIQSSRKDCPADLSAEKESNDNNKRPLKLKSQDVNFKGLSSIKVSDAVKRFGDEFGATAAENFKNKIANASAFKDSGLSVKNDVATFTSKNLGERFVDLLKYPIVEMPLDIANSILVKLKKAGIKNSKILNNLLETETLKNRRTFKEDASEVAAIQHYFEIASSGKGAFSEAHKRFSPYVSNYDSVSEKFWTRVVTGAIPAFYLANDAYNLSIYMNDNKKLAKKEKKRRFNQELGRIAITAGATFGVLKLFSKSANGSGAATLYLMSALTFASEIIGRKLAGTPILPLNEKGAKKYAKKQGKDIEQKIDSPNKSNKISNNKETATNVEKDEKGHKKGGLTFSNALKVAGAMVVVGFGIEKATGIKSVKKVLGDLNKKYINSYSKDFVISRNEFNKLTKRLEDNGFDKIAQKYKDIAKNQKGDSLKLGMTQVKAKHMLIHNVLAFPFRFSYSVLMLPYKGIVKPICQMIIKGVSKVTKSSEIEKVVKKEEIKKHADKDIEMLRHSIQYLRKIDKKPNYQEHINKSLLGSLDNATKSSYSNADFNVVLKNVMSAITSGFLIADNYNLVMIDSGGKDKKLAEQKAKERTIQRTMRIVYGAFLIKFLNGLFAGPFNASLLAAQGVNALYAVSTETLERSSVGLPLNESTRDKMQEMDAKNASATGLKGAYFRMMANLTGKKPLPEKK